MRFDTIYFGGGTPSLLDPDDDLTASSLRDRESIRSELRGVVQRIFLEANPEDVTAELVGRWHGAGVSTLSLGVQSFDPPSLGFLGRRHTPDDARRSIELAREAGFETVSIDLIYGLPGQTDSAWQAELERALELGADHISCYQLTIHERTRFALLEKRGRLTQLPSERQGELFRMTHRLLNDAGMQGYEVSQFAAGVEHRSRHNLKYWDHSPYLGVGPSAHSYEGDRRWWNIRRTDPWQDRVDEGARPIDGEESLDRTALTLEALMTGLRTYAGVDVAAVRSRWGVDLLERNGALVERLEDQGMLRVEQTRLVPTLDGLAFADSLASRFEL